MLLVAVAGLLSAWPSIRWGGIKNLHSLIAAGILVLMAAIVSLIPIVIAAQRKADWLGQACLGATVVRLLLTISLGSGWYLMAKPPMMAFMVWMVLFYLVLLVWETITAMRFVKKVYG